MSKEALTLALEMIQNKMYAHAEMYLTEALAKQEQGETRPYAGVTIWGGDVKVTKLFTRVQIEQVRSPRALFEFAVQQSLNELAIHGIKENT